MNKANSAQIPVFVLGSSVCNSLGVARGFGRRGIPVFVFDDRPSPLHRVSRYGTFVRCPKLEPSDSSAAQFIHDYAVKLGERPVLISTSDRAALYELGNRRQLDGVVRYTASDEAVSRALIRKDLFYEAAARVGVPHPRTIRPNSIEDAVAACDELGYPCLLKPATSYLFLREFDEKCLVVHDRDMLCGAWKRIEQLSLNVLVQELIPGHRIYMWYGYYDRNSSLVAACGYQKVRQYPPGIGSGALVKAFDDHHLISQADRLLRHVGYHGIVEPEFKFDEREGEWKILEINARTSTQNRLPASMGRDMEYLAYCEAVGQPLHHLNDGTSHVWTESHCDLASALLDPQVTFRDWWKSRRGRKVYAIFSADDPLPAVVHLKSAVRTVASALIKRCLARSPREKRPHSYAGTMDAQPSTLTE